MDYISHLENGILKHWIKFGPDPKNGGYYCDLDKNWLGRPDSPKGLVFHCRLLWTFSRVYRKTSNRIYAEAAVELYEYIWEKFYDRNNGGWFYSVDAAGSPLDTRKHVYTHSFVIYALSEYFHAFGDRNAFNKALDTFLILEDKAHDSEHLGYVESFDQKWNEIDQHEDFGISGKRKSMNSHIHMLEGVTNFYDAAIILGTVDSAVKERLLEIHMLCMRQIFNEKRGSLDLFFEKDWTRIDSPTSYGHDIELSWLLGESADYIGLKDETLPVTMRLAHNSLKGISDKRGLFYEGDSTGVPNDKRMVWWVQAEGLIGFLNAYQLSGEHRLFDAFKKIETWVFSRQVDALMGDWHEEISEHDRIKATKAHLWKDPYHQSRACLEVQNRLEKMYLH